VEPQRRLIWFRRLGLAGAALAATVVVLGAWVRLTDAGLGCPDWPGCYGHVYPQADHNFSKAIHEMIHRYFATTLGAIILGLLGWAVWNRKAPGQPLKAVALLFVLVCLQGALGALTVTLLLKPLIVTAHLLGGLSTLAILWWLSLTPERRELQGGEMG
jgi:heme a synthase